MLVPEDLRESTLKELKRMNKIELHTERTSTGAADRNYLLALGLLELYGGGIRISKYGEAFLSKFFPLSGGK